MNTQAHSPSGPTDTATADWRSLLLPLAIALSVGLDYFDNSAFSFFIGEIAGGIAAPPDELIWSSSAYAVASVLGILQQQWWIERLGNRHYIGLCLLLFAAGSLACTLSQSSLELAMARSLQGYVMGPMLSACRILLQLGFAPARRAGAVRIFLLMILLCSALAPLAGGYLVAAFGWRSVFYCTMFAGLLIAALVFLVLPATGRVPAHEREQPPLWPYVGAAVALASLQVVVQQLRYTPFSESPWLQGLTLIGLLILGGFVWQQWRHPHPLLRLHGLRDATFRTGLVLYALYYFISNALGYLVSRLLQVGLGYPVQNAGQLVGMTSLAALGGAIIYFRYSGQLTHKKWIFVPGFLLAAGISGWFAILPPNVSMSWLVLPLALRGLLLMFVALPVANLAFQAFTSDLYPHSYRIKNVVKQIAYSTSTATIIVLEQHRLAFHHTVLAANISPGNPALRDFLAPLSRHFEQAGYAAAAAQSLAMAQVERLITQQANFMSFLDGFAFLTVLSIGAALFALWQRRIR
ncbi:MFS transporter [Pseudomonas sp. PNP]|uniref:MFS transporter n=1 Tax=Pseudomonas sp. PNP TaxID=361819 RepID=UPI001AECFD47|nr:MFS transporter [Pseudomonas sp. PNP]MBP2839274.1 MFS transporter [Pseudomonas sp. PNP]